MKSTKYFMSFEKVNQVEPWVRKFTARTSGIFRFFLFILLFLSVHRPIAAGQQLFSFSTPDLPLLSPFSRLLILLLLLVSGNLHPNSGQVSVPQQSPNSLTLSAPARLEEL